MRVFEIRSANPVYKSPSMTWNSACLRPEELRWPDWVDGQLEKIRRGLDMLKGESLGDGVDIGTISVACALGYLDFRYPDERWRDSRPKLAAWFEKFAARPSMGETLPE